MSVFGIQCNRDLIRIYILPVERNEQFMGKELFLLDKYKRRTRNLICNWISVCRLWVQVPLSQMHKRLEMIPVASVNIRGSFQKFCTLYFFFLKLDLFYKIHLQAFNVISTVLCHSGPTFGQVLYCCQDAFVVDASDYSGHLITQLLNASEAFPTEWFLQFWEQVKVWLTHVWTLRRVGKHLPSIRFQNFRYCTWGMRQRVNVWSLVTARDLTPVSFFFHFKAPFCGTGTTYPASTHKLFVTEVWLTAVAKIRTIASSYWPRKRSVQTLWNDLRVIFFDAGWIFLWPLLVYGKK